MDPAGKRLHDAALLNNEPKLRAVFDKLAAHGPVLVVVDQPATIGALPVAVARSCGHPVAYLPGLAMRRVANLYPGRAKTDARDAFLIFDAARALPHPLRQVDFGDDTLAELDVLVGFDDDLAGETTRIGNRIRGLLTAIHPTLERVLGSKITHPAVLEIRPHPARGSAPPRPSSPPRTWPPTPALSRSPAPPAPRSGATIPPAPATALKRAFFLAAFAALADTASRAYYDRKRAEAKKHHAALICLARRRCDVLFAMLRNKTLYQTPAPQAAA